MVRKHKVERFEKRSDKSSSGRAASYREPQVIKGTTRDDMRRDTYVPHQDRTAAATHWTSA